MPSGYVIADGTVRNASTGLFLRLRRDDLVLDLVVGRWRSVPSPACQWWLGAAKLREKIEGVFVLDIHPAAAVDFVNHLLADAVTALPQQHQISVSGLCPLRSDRRNEK